MLKLQKAIQSPINSDPVKSVKGPLPPISRGKTEMFPEQNNVRKMCVKE